MFRQKTLKFLYTGAIIFVLMGFKDRVISQTVDSIDKIDYEELLDLLINSVTEESYNKYNAIYSKLNIEQLHEFNKVALKKSLEEQLCEKATNKWILMSEEQIRNSVYNAGLLYEFLLKYSLEEFQKPYNQLPLSETIKLAEKVEKDSPYRSKKREVCNPNSEVKP